MDGRELAFCVCLGKWYLHASHLRWSDLHGQQTSLWSEGTLNGLEHVPCLVQHHGRRQDTPRVYAHSLHPRLLPFSLYSKLHWKWQSQRLLDMDVRPIKGENLNIKYFDRKPYFRSPSWAIRSSLCCGNRNWYFCTGITTSPFWSTVGTPSVSTRPPPGGLLSWTSLSTPSCTHTTHSELSGNYHRLLIIND